MHKLVMVFNTEVPDKTATVTVDDLKMDETGKCLIKEAEVVALMNLMIAKNIFHCKTGDLKSKKSAKIVTTETASVDL